MDGSGGDGDGQSRTRGGASRATSEEAEQAGPATATAGAGREDTAGGAAAGGNSGDAALDAGIKGKSGGVAEALGGADLKKNEGDAAPGASGCGSVKRDLVAPADDEHVDDDGDDVPLSQLKEYQERHSPRRSGRAVKHKYDDEDEEEEEEEEMEQFSDDSEEYVQMDDNEDWMSSYKRDAAASEKTDKYGNPFTNHQCPHCERCFSGKTCLDYHTRRNICKNGTLPPQGKNGGLHTTDPEIDAAVRRGDADVAVDPLGKKKRSDKKERLCIIRGCSKLRRPGKARMCVRHKKDWSASGMPWPSQAEEIAKAAAEVAAAEAAAVAAGAGTAKASTSGAVDAATDSPSSRGGRSKRATAVKSASTSEAAIASDEDIEEDDTDATSTDNGDGDDDEHAPEDAEEEAEEVIVDRKGKTGRGYDTSPPEVNAAVKRGDISAVDPVPRFNKRKQRCCIIKGCAKLGRNASSAFMCSSHHKDWLASGCVLPDVGSVKSYKAFAKANGRKPTKYVDTKSFPSKSTANQPTAARARRGGGGRPSRPVRSTSADACYIDGCDMPKEAGTETCEEHSRLHSGKRRGRARSEDEREEGSEGKLENQTAIGTGIRSKKGSTGLWKNLCRVEGCPKYLQRGRDGMCAAHFNATKVYGVDAVLAEGMEVGAQTKVDYNARSARTKNESKPKGSPRESPRKARAKRSERHAEKPSTSTREPSPKRSKSVEPTKPPTPRQLEKELGLPKHDDGGHWSSCIVGNCELGIQIPREYRMCRSHYRELVENETKDKQKMYAQYASLMRPPRSPQKKMPKAVPKAVPKAKSTPRKRKMSTDGIEEEEGAGKTKRETKRRTTKEMPTVVDDRTAPDTTEEAVASASAQVCDVWRLLPSNIDLNSPPPIPESVSYGDVNVDSASDAKPMADENTQVEKSATKKDGLKHLPTEFIRINPKMNYNVIHMAVKARLAAKNYSAALLLCQKALLDWYDQAENCARFHRRDSPKRAIDLDIPSLEAVCDSLAGLWCVYAWLLQELVALNPPKKSDDTDAAVSETKLSPSSLSSSTPSTDRKFLSGVVIPENLFALSHDLIRWSDVLAALKVATNCHLAGRRAWPWLVRARVTVQAAEAEASGKTKTTPPNTTKGDATDQSNASDILLKSYGDAVGICREGISRVSVLPSTHLAKSRKLLVPTSIQGVTLPFFGQDNARALCREINHMFDMKQRVEKALLVQNGNAVGAETSSVMNGISNGPKSQGTSDQSHEAIDQYSSAVISAVLAVEWLCNGCAEHFSSKDAFLSHKKGCPNATLGGEEGKGIDDQEMHAASEMFNVLPLSRTSIFSEADATDVLDYLVEIFPATKDDMGTKMGRPAKVEAESDDHTTKGSDHAGLLANTPVFEGQVGLRCIHCRDNDGTTGVVYPTNVSDLPRAMWRLKVSHFERCKCLPDDCRARYEIMRNFVAPESSSSKRYWNEVADGLRLQDTSKGIMWPNGSSGNVGAEKAVVRFDGSV